MKRIGTTIVALAVLAGSSTPAAAADDPVTIDVVVTDAKARPVTDLSPADLELTDSGEPRTVDAVRLQSGGPRVVGIFLDEFHVQSGDSSARVRTALMSFIDTQLRDGDLVAIAKPLDPLHAIAFTKDHNVIRQAITAFEGHAGDFTPRSEFERNFMSRDPKTAAVSRAQVVSAALQALARRLGEHDGRKALIFLTEGFQPAQPRAIIATANRNKVAIHAIDPSPEAGDYDSMLRVIAEQTGGQASLNNTDLSAALRQTVADLDHYFVVTFQPTRPGDGQFHPVQLRVKRTGANMRSRSGYWAPDAALAAAAAKAAAPRFSVPFRQTHASPYIRPWIGMSRGTEGLTRVAVTWEPGDAAPRNQRLMSVVVKAFAADGTVLFERRIGPGEREYIAFNAAPGPIALEMALQSSSGAPLDTDYRGVVVPNLKVTKTTLATPQVLRTRTARQFDEASRNPEAAPVAARTFSRTERLIVRVPAYAPLDATPVVTGKLLNRRGVAMRDLEAVAADLPPGVVQFDLPLASLAPDEYRVELLASNPSVPGDQVREIIVLRVTN